MQVIIFLYFGLVLLAYLGSLIALIRYIEMTEYRGMQIFFKIMLLSPFWLFFVAHSIDINFPELKEMIFPYQFKQEIIIENDTDSPASIMLLSRNQETMKWDITYPARGSGVSPFIDLEPWQVLTRVYDARQFDRMLFEYAPERQKENDSTSTGAAFMVPVPPKTIKLFVSELTAKKTVALKPNLGLTLQNLLMYFIAVIGIISHALSMKKFVARIILGSIALIVSVFSGYMFCMYLKTILYFL